MCFSKCNEDFKLKGEGEARVTCGKGIKTSTAVMLNMFFPEGQGCDLTRSAETNQDKKHLIILRDRHSALYLQKAALVLLNGCLWTAACLCPL